MRHGVALHCACQLPVKDELDVKVLDDPNEVADLKTKLIYKLRNLQTSCANLDPFDDKTRKGIKIIDVEYAIICGTLF